jgi:hypothetical protein
MSEDNTDEQGDSNSKPLAASRGSRTVKKPNRVKKGAGPDGAADPWDNYWYKEDRFYKRLCARANGEPSSQYLFRVCSTLERQFDWLLNKSIFAVRRVPVAYSWLKKCESTPLLNITFDRVADEVAEEFEQMDHKIYVGPRYAKP